MEGITVKLKRCFVVLLLVVLVGCLGLLPFVVAHTTQIGLTGYGGYNGDVYANQMIIEKFSTAGLTPSLTYEVVNGSFYTSNGQLGWCKLVVLSLDRIILGVSEPVNCNAQATLWNVTFPSGVYVNSLDGYIGLGLISASGGKTTYYSGSMWATDGSNSYDNPSNPTDVSYAGSIVPLWVTVTSEFEGAPTPTPVPPTPTFPPVNTPFPTSHPWVTPSPTPVPTGMSGGDTAGFGSSFYWVFIVLGSALAFLFGLFSLLGDKGNRAVNVLIAVVSLVVFVVVLFAIGVL